MADLSKGGNDKGSGNGLGWWGNTLRGGLDRILPGEQRGADGRLIGSQVGKGVLGRVASIGASFLAGPAAGAVTNRLAGNWIDRSNPFNFGPGTGPGAALYRRIAGVPEPTRVTVVQGDNRSNGQTGPTNNLGFGGGVPAGGVYRDPYLGWTSYLAPQGSIDNFGNNNIRTQPAVGGGWQPSSQWGRDMLNGGADSSAGGNRFFGSDQFSSGRGGATTVTDPTAASAITSWAAGAAMNPGFRAFSRAKK